MKYYRQLERGEKRKATDFQPAAKGRIEPVNSPNLTVEEDVILRPVQADEWVSFAERKPTAEDFAANPLEYLQFMFDDGSTGTWRRHDGSNVTAAFWRRCTPPKPVEEPIVIAGHTAKVNTDKSVTVGCTTIPADTVRKFVERWSK